MSSSMIQNTIELNEEILSQFLWGFGSVGSGIVDGSESELIGKPFVGWQSHSQYIAVSTLQDEIFKELILENRLKDVELLKC